MHYGDKSWHIMSRMHDHRLSEYLALAWLIGKVRVERIDIGQRKR